MGHQRTTFSIDALLRRIARPQLGLVTYGQATNAGIDKHALARRRRSGALVEVVPGVLLVDPVPLTAERRILAAALAVPGSIVTGPSAAVVWGLPVPRPQGDDAVHRPVLSIDRDRIIRLAAIRTVRQRSAPPSRRWFTTRATTPAGTLLSLPRFAGAEVVERCLDHALAHRLFTARSLLSLVESWPLAGFTGRRLLIELLLARTEGIGHRSRLEHLVARWLEQAGLGGWSRNARVHVGAGRRVEVDFAWLAPRVVLEVSPFFTHGSRRTQERDAERRRLLVEARWRVIEATDRDLVNARTFRPTVASLQRCLGQ